MLLPQSVESRAVLSPHLVEWVAGSELVGNIYIVHMHYKLVFKFEAENGTDINSVAALMMRLRIT